MLERIIAVDGADKMQYLSLGPRATLMLLCMHSMPLSLERCQKTRLSPSRQLKSNLSTITRKTKPLNESKYFTNPKLSTNVINELLAKSMAGSLNIVASNSTVVSLADFGRENSLVTLIPRRHEKDLLLNVSQQGGNN